MSILILQNQAAQHHLALYLTVLLYEFDRSRFLFSSRQLSDVVLLLAYLQVLQLCDTSNRRGRCCGRLS